MKILLLLTLLLASTFSAASAIFTVTNVNDSGAWSLRAAINNANGSPGSTVTFNIPGTNIHTIAPLSPLPAITVPTTINGYSQTGSVMNSLAIGDNASLRIVLAGTNLTNGVALELASSGCTVKGLVINGFRFGAIAVEANNGLISGNFIGTDNSGTVLRTNGGFGVWLAGGSNNLVGGTTPQSRNIIAGSDVGVDLYGGSSNLIQGNYIGTDAMGTNALPNLTGVSMRDNNGAGLGNLIGGAISGAGNVISGNSYNAGVVVLMDDVTIQGNIIGLDSSGMVPLGNYTGVQIFGFKNNLVGGTNALARNIISGNAFDGIQIMTGNSNYVFGNFIGPDITGLNNQPNYNGVEIYGEANQIGGGASSMRNIISGNLGVGLAIFSSFSSNNIVAGNYIGLAADGFEALGNGLGIFIDDAPGNTIGGFSSGERNIVTANFSDGIQLTGGNATGNLISANFIGTGPFGGAYPGNAESGIHLVQAPQNTIGGSLVGARNVISGNGERGVYIEGPGSGGNTVLGNYIGLAPAGGSVLPNGFEGVLIESAPNTLIGGTNAAARNIISGNNGIGVNIQGDGATNNVVQGNYIGLDETGSVGPGNLDDGIYIYATGNTIGGAVPGAGNVIGGNVSAGIELDGDSCCGGNVVQGNYIGTAADGLGNLGNSGEGIFIRSCSNLVGGTMTSARNILSGNDNNGMTVFGAGNLIEGNYIGIDVTGTNAQPNSFVGIYMGGSFNQIGGTNSAARNVIAGNYQSGVYISSEFDGDSNGFNIVQGNYIGTDPSGALALANAWDGIVVTHSPGNTIGGTAAGAGNLISGNGHVGLALDNAIGTVIQGNLVGTDFSGAVALGNAQDGVRILDSSANAIGGTPVGAANTIAFNGAAGVTVEESGINLSLSNSILGNRIFQNAGLDIDLNADGFTPNDPGDNDQGPNNLQNFPVLTSASTAGGTTVRGTLNSQPGRKYRLEFFDSDTLLPTNAAPNVGEAQLFLGAINVTTDNGGNASFIAALPVPVTPSLHLSATATDPQNNTSELSPATSASLSLAIGSLSASHGQVGSTLTIYGTNFDQLAQNDVVYFGAVRATVLSASPTNLVVVVPPGAAYGPITVTVAGLTAFSAVPFVPTFASAHSLSSQSFAPGFHLPPGTLQTGMAVGDLDGDGRPDLVVAVQSNSVTAFIYQNIEPGANLGSNSFAPPQILYSGGFTRAVALADIDGDGLLDLIFLKSSPDQLEIRRNLSTPGNLLFEAPHTFSALGGGIGALAIADIDGDGLPDVIATGMTNNQVAVFRNTSSPESINLAAHVDFAAGSAPVGLAVADLDGDGRPDLIVSDAGGGGGPCSVLRNLSSPGAIATNSFAPEFLLVSGAPNSSGVVAADFDGDGKPDIAVSVPAADTVLVYRNVRVPGSFDATSFALPVHLGAPGGPLGLAVADLDGDGKLELICANTNALPISVFWNLATPGSINALSFSRIGLPVGFTSFAVAAGDFDGDGKPDLVVLGTNPDNLAVSRNQGNEPVILVNTIPPPDNAMVVTNSAAVQISSRFTNGTVFYTLDGSPPDTGSALYLGPFAVNQSIILRVLALDSNQLAAESLPLTINVIAPPSITLQPQGLIADTGDDVAFAVTTAGTAPLTYQWMKNGVSIPGATNSFLFFPNVPLAQAGGYSVTVSNAYGVITSTNAILTLRTAPSVLTQPSNTSGGIGGAVTFTISVVGAGPITFQWRRNGANIVGATNSTLTITNIQFSDGATYTVVASSPGGTVIGGPAQLLVNGIASQAGGDNFASATALSGLTNSVTSTNTFATREPGEPLHAGKPGSNSVWYTWTPGSGNKGIATFSTAGSAFDTLLAVYTGSSVSNLTSVASDDDSGGYLTSKVTFNASPGNTYYIAVDGFNGQKGRFILQWSAERTNGNVPVITCHPANQTALKGGTASFSVSATGSSLAYQWLFNGTNLSGATNSFYVRTNVQTSNVGFYNVRVTGAGNRTVDSLTAILEIGPFPDVQSKDKPDDVFPACGGAFAPFAGFFRVNDAGGASSVSMGSIGSQSLVAVSTNNVVDCNTTNCGGIPRGTRYFELTASDNATFIVDTSGSASQTRMWVCAKGVSNLDPTRTFLKCDTTSAPDGHSLVRLDAEAGRTYQAWIAKLDNTNGALQLNWRLGLPPVLYAVPPVGFLAEGATLTLTASATNIIASGVTAPLAAPTLAWYLNGNFVGSGSPLIIPNVTPANAGQYTVIASNAMATTSAVVRVEVYGAAGSLVLNNGGGIELFADDSIAACPGGAPPTYHWNFNGAPIVGQTGRSLILRDVQPSQAGAYSVTVTNCFGVTTYTNTTVAVTLDVGFIAQIDRAGRITLAWRTTPGRSYRVEYRTSLNSPTWTQLGSDLLAASTSLSVTDSMSNGPRFYRIVLLGQ